MLLCEVHEAVIPCKFEPVHDLGCQIIDECHCADILHEPEGWIRGAECSDSIVFIWVKLVPFDVSASTSVRTRHLFAISPQDGRPVYWTMVSIDAFFCWADERVNKDSRIPCVRTYMIQTQEETLRPMRQKAEARAQCC